MSRPEKARAYELIREGIAIDIAIQLINGNFGEDNGMNYVIDLYYSPPDAVWISIWTKGNWQTRNTFRI